MKRLAMVIFLFMASSLFGDQYVNGYFKQDGTQVKGHFKTDSNETKRDNYSTYGNTNPYTGKAGTKTYSDYNNYGYQKGYKSSNSYKYGK